MVTTLNYWWVTRPKRKLNSIPEVLGAFSNVALECQWSGKRNVHILFEEELEKNGIKRVGERRDHSGSGGRTYQAWLSSLGLIFIQEKSEVPFLTLAGEAIIDGKPPVEVLKKQVLNYQFPSPFGIKTRVSDSFKVHPFVFILRLLADKRVSYLSQEELAKVVITYGYDDSNKCFEDVVKRIIDFRNYGDSSLPADFLNDHKPSTGIINLEHPYSHLVDAANTMINWIEYTQLIYREDPHKDDKKRELIIRILPERADEVDAIISRKYAFIPRPEDHEFFQRRYGVDPWHIKDSRNLLKTSAVSSKTIETQRIKQAFIAYTMHKPIPRIDSNVVFDISKSTGTDKNLVEEVLNKTYPHGAIGGFLAGYYEMAFKGQDEAIDFEKATSHLFQDVLGFNAVHLGQMGARSAPDVLLVSDSDGYQAIIDNKAYSEYSITGDHHNRMVHNYIENISNYSQSNYPIGFFTYIAGGFKSTIDKQIRSEVKESNVPGSGITVSNMIKLIEKHQEIPYSHGQLRDMFGLNRQIHLSDIEQKSRSSAI